MAPTQGVNISIDSFEVHVLHKRWYSKQQKYGFDNIYDSLHNLRHSDFNQCNQVEFFDPFKVMLWINPCYDSNRPFLLWHKERNPAIERVK